MRISPNWIVWGAFISVLTTSIAASAQTTELKLGENGVDGDRHTSAVTQTIDTPSTGSNISTIATDIPNLNPTDLPNLDEIEHLEDRSNISSPPIQTSLSRNIEDTRDIQKPAAPKLSWLDRGDRLSGKAHESGLVGIKGTIEFAAVAEASEVSESAEPAIADTDSSVANSIETVEQVTEKVADQANQTIIQTVAPTEQTDLPNLDIEVSEVSDRRDQYSDSDKSDRQDQSPVNEHELITDQATEIVASPEPEELETPTISDQNAQVVESIAAQVDPADANIENLNAVNQANTADIESEPKANIAAVTQVVTDIEAPETSATSEPLERSQVSQSSPESAVLEEVNVSATDEDTEVAEVVEVNEEIAIANANAPDISSANEIEQTDQNEATQVEVIDRAESVAAKADIDAVSEQIEQPETEPDQLVDLDANNQVAINPETPTEAEVNTTDTDQDAEVVAIADLDLDPAVLAAEQSIDNVDNTEVATDPVELDGTNQDLEVEPEQLATAKVEADQPTQLENQSEATEEVVTAVQVATIADIQAAPVSYVEVEAKADQPANAEDVTENAAETKTSEPEAPESAESIAEAELVASIPTAKPLVVPTSPTQVQIEKVQPITLEEAVAIALQNSEQITQSQITVEQRRATLEEALAAFKPTVDAQVDYTVNDSAQVRANNVASAFGISQDTVSHRLNGTVGVNYNVFTSGRRSANVRVAENQLRIAEADLNRVIQAVQLDVISAYYNTQSADEQVRIQQKSVENNQRSLQDTSALERAGVGTKFDVLQAEVQLANAQQDLLDAEANQRIARRELARQLNFSDTLDLTAADPIKPAPDWNKSIEESVLMALRNRSELDIRKLQREVARDQAKATLANLGPQVRVFANYDLFDDLTATGGVAMGYRFGAVLSMNLFDGGVARAQAKQRLADAALAESRFEQDSDQIRFEVEQAYINLESRREQIDTASLAVESATEALRLARLRLSAGVGTQLEVIRAEDDLVRAEVNQLLAVIGYNQSLASLQRAINGL
jgi:outer membrane protein TolC